MTTLPPDVAAKLLRADLAKIIAKSKDPNKRLTVAERNMLAQMAAADAGAEPGVSEPRAGSPPYADSIAALCGILGVSRKCFYHWRRKWKDEVPANKTNGQYDVAAWREFAKRRGLKGGEEDPVADSPDAEDIEELKRENLRIKNERLRWSHAVDQGEYIHKDDVTREWSQNVRGAISLMRNKFENELPPIQAGADAITIRHENARAIDEICELLHFGYRPGPDEGADEP